MYTAGASRIQKSRSDSTASAKTGPCMRLGSGKHAAPGLAEHSRGSGVPAQHKSCRSCAGWHWVGAPGHPRTPWAPSPMSTGVAA